MNVIKNEYVKIKLTKNDKYSIKVHKKVVIISKKYCRIENKTFFCTNTQL